MSDLKDKIIEIEQMQADLERQKLEIIRIEKETSERDKKLMLGADKLNEALNDAIDKEKFLEFFKRPYVLIQRGQNRCLVAVPKYIKNFQVGWLWKEDNSFYIYQIDQYSGWLGDVPPEILSQVNFKQQLEATVIGNKVFFEPADKENIKKHLGQNMVQNLWTENTATIIKGREFLVIAEMIDKGNLPFRPNKVQASDLRPAKLKTDPITKKPFALYSYQEPALKDFLEWGAIGLFHPTGAGKSIISIKIMDIIAGKKLVIVPTRTLVEQWNWYINTYLPDYKKEIEIATYQGFNDYKTQYALVIFDECQKLPANTFSKLAVINAKYRMGLSASPHREDGRERYIFALTGKPVGLNWADYMKERNKKYHPIFVHVVNQPADKMKKVKQLVNMNKKTLIFSDGLELGNKIAAALNIPFVSGETKNNLETLLYHKVVAASRVADLGTSIKDLQHVIEVDFLFGSRSQELQRTGRLLHSDAPDTRHDIIFTEKEFESYNKRLWSLQEKGFTIKMMD